MTKKSKTIALLGTLAIAVVAFLLLNSQFGLTGGFGRVVDGLIARNVEARGGVDAWRAVDSLRVAGRMDLGQGMNVPYTIEQKRPGKMCLEFEFDGEVATQCVTGDSGWKVLPYLGRTRPEPMTDIEFREMADTADIDGLLIDAARRGHDVSLVGKEMVNGREAFKLEVTLPRGAKRWIYLDAETGLEVKLETMRMRNGREQLVETWYSDWRETDGLLIPHRQDSKAEGNREMHWLTVERVIVNPSIDDQRFERPALASSAGGSTGSNPS
jgi:hypothetical protein